MRHAIAQTGSSEDSVDHGWREATQLKLEDGEASIEGTNLPVLGISPKQELDQLPKREARLPSLSRHLSESSGDHKSISIPETSSGLR